MSKELSINIQEVKRLVKEEGMTRDEIAAHYKISKKACREQIFSHPELKGIRKPQKPRGVQITLTGASDSSEEAADTKETPKGESKEEAPAEKETPSKEAVSESNADLQGEAKEEGGEEEEVAHSPHFSADEEESEEEEEEEESTDTEEKPSSGVEW